MHVLRSVEAGWSAGADSVCAEGLDGFFLEGFVRDKIVEVGGGEVGHGAAVSEFGFRACCSVCFETKTMLGINSRRSKK